MHLCTAAILLQGEMEVYTGLRAKLCEFGFRSFINYYWKSSGYKLCLKSIRSTVKKKILFVPPCQSSVVGWGKGVNQKPEIGRVPLSESDCSFPWESLWILWYYLSVNYYYKLHWVFCFVLHIIFLTPNKTLVGSGKQLDVFLNSYLHLTFCEEHYLSVPLIETFKNASFPKCLICWGFCSFAWLFFSGKIVHIEDVQCDDLKLL